MELIQVLRHPIERLIAQYFATAETTAEYDSFAHWVQLHSKPPPRRGNDGATKLWIELDNAIVKVMSGFDGRRAATLETVRRKKLGLPSLSRRELEHFATTLQDPQASLAAAKATLSERFTHVLIAEWLTSPMSVALLGDQFCFAHDRGDYQSVPPQMNFVRVRRKRASARGKPNVPALNFEQVRAERRSNTSFWRAAQPVLADLAQRNALDVELYTWAANRLKTQLEAHWRQQQLRTGSSAAAATGGLAGTDSVPLLPALPCSGLSGAHCWSDGPPGVDQSSPKVG